MPALLTTIADLHAWTDEQRSRDETIGFVPTMGALHDGHLSLVRRAGELADATLVSIFVNPLQFGAGEDLGKYPRTLDADLAALDGLADAVFAPSVDEMYPDGPLETRVTAGEVGTWFEGAARPGHFDGVLTVVAKLFNLAQADVAVFGQKDAQQVFLIERMVRDLSIPTRIEVAPTVRGADGLALSSRNRYLSDEQRDLALTLSRAIRAAAEAGSQGAEAAVAAGRAVFDAEPTVELGYFTLVAPNTFREVAPGATGPARAIVAARVGTTRLIDNGLVTLN
ncbi:MAG TPA: pantoate--beta-alanine ligase [Candidatus Lumbricidophila sp.]|nr:pantoate--beta-alanine ligase [Candidatus Lumbricidophila sp.]